MKKTGNMQNSRDRILAAVAANKPNLLPLPVLPDFEQETDDASFILQKFRSTATTIGSKLYMVKDLEEAKAMIIKQFDKGRIITTLPELADIAETDLAAITDPHNLQDVELLVMKAHFGVAENS